jgi:hypothetical protein
LVGKKLEKSFHKVLPKAWHNRMEEESSKLCRLKRRKKDLMKRKKKPFCLPLCTMKIFEGFLPNNLTRFAGCTQNVITIQLKI